MPVDDDFPSIRVAAEEGDAGAQNMLGLQYFYGEGVPRDYALALSWLRKAADQDLPDAQFKIGFIYADGRGVAKDYAQALKWFRLAADQGHAGGQWGLGHLYDAGHGVPRDIAEALKWYRKAADQGDTSAQFGLGFSCETGDGVPQDAIQAHMWFSIAATGLSENLADEHNFALRSRDRIASQLTQSDLAESQRRANEWRGTTRPRRRWHADVATVVFRDEFFDDGSSEIQIVVSTRLRLNAQDPQYDKDRLDRLTAWVQQLVRETPGAKGYLIEESVADN